MLAYARCYVTAYIQREVVRQMVRADSIKPHVEGSPLTSTKPGVLNGKQWLSLC